ncbi:MAG: FAD-binding oxidoreductase [Candidatus Ranarchaeia archaeon]|jgi:FAD/FMN-containing dehydrogenase
MDLEQIAINSNASIFRNIDPTTNMYVFHPSTLDELKVAIAKAKEQDLPIVPKGGGTSLSGACTGGNFNKVIITTRSLKAVHNINTKNQTATVDAGVTPVELNKHLASKNYRFYVSPSSESAAHMGGMLNTDAGGADAWLNGTMLDNTQAVDLVDYDGNEIHITHEGSSSSNSSQSKDLERLDLNLGDIAQSHGTLGFIHQLTVKIRSITSGKINTGVWSFPDVNAFGRGIQTIISQQIPLHYSEGIVEVHPSLEDETSFPILFTSFPEKVTDLMLNLDGFELVSQEDHLKMRALRKSLPKRNPPIGAQKAYFEGYGIPQLHLNKLGDILEEIDEIWRTDGIEPFLRYGHSPCKWYVNHKPVYGMIMHAREVVAKRNSTQIMNTLEKVLDYCDKKGIIPKPEHKWPYQKTQKKDRLILLQQLLGNKFNPFVLKATRKELIPLML